MEYSIRTKQKRVFLISSITLCVCAFFVCGAGNGDSVAIQDLLKNRSAYNGQKVVVQGEAVGCLLKGDQKGFCWLNIKDSTGAMGVVLDCALAAPILYYGSYRFRGDVVRMEGVFSKDCAQHAHELDVHVQTLAVIQRGSEREEHVSEKKLRTAEMLGIISLFLGLIYFIRKELAK